MPNIAVVVAEETVRVSAGQEVSPSHRQRCEYSPFASVNWSGTLTRGAVTRRGVEPSSWCKLRAAAAGSTVSTGIDLEESNRCTNLRELLVEMLTTESAGSQRCWDIVSVSPSLSVLSPEKTSVGNVATMDVVDASRPCRSMTTAPSDRQSAYLFDERKSMNRPLLSSD